MTVGIENFGRTGILTINSVVLNCLAWDVWRCEQLEGNMETSGSNVGLAGVSGKRARRMRYDEVEYSLPMRVSGEVDVNDVPQTDALAGLSTNRLYLVANVQDPVFDGGAETVPATLLLPNGVSLGADVQPLFIFGETVSVQSKRNAFCNAVLRLVVPAGRFE